MTDPQHEQDGIMRRAEALVMSAQINAANHKGDAATAAADLMMAFVLLTTRCGSDPRQANEVIIDNAIIACADFWGSDGRRLDA